MHYKINELKTEQGPYKRCFWQGVILDKIRGWQNFAALHNLPCGYANAYPQDGPAQAGNPGL